jgi:hypothetical protein
MGTQALWTAGGETSFKVRGEIRGAAKSVGDSNAEYPKKQAGRGFSRNIYFKLQTFALLFTEECEASSV